MLIACELTGVMEVAATDVVVEVVGVGGDGLGGATAQQDAQAAARAVARARVEARHWSRAIELAQAEISKAAKELVLARQLLEISPWVGRLYTERAKNDWHAAMLAFSVQMSWLNEELERGVEGTR